MQSRHLGFTLIELMITVTVVAILAAVAFPSYQQHVRKSRRAEAQSFMMAVASRQQQFLVDTRSYAATVSAVGVAVPANVTQGYAVALDVPVGGTTFTLTLTPTSVQSADACGTLGIDQSGTKSPTTSGCW
jgi:type IV pilus assembly protein PilE